MRQAILAGAVVAALFAQGAQAQDMRPFECPGDAVPGQFRPYQEGYRQQLQALSDGRTEVDVLIHYTVEDWDAAWMMQQCEAFANGQQADLGCLHDRRNWQQIQEMLPANYLSMSDNQIRAITNPMTRDDSSWISAQNFCHRRGVEDARPTR